MKNTFFYFTGWFEAAVRCRALYETLKAQVLASSYVQAMRHPYQYWTAKRKGTHRVITVYHGVESKLVYLITAEQGGKGYGTVEKLPCYLQTDGYGVYEGFESRDNMS
jgi:hypothetical protein